MATGAGGHGVSSGFTPAASAMGPALSPEEAAMYAIVPVGEVTDATSGSGDSGGRGDGITGSAASRRRRALRTPEEKAEEILRIGGAVDGVATEVGGLLELAESAGGIMDSTDVDAGSTGGGPAESSTGPGGAPPKSYELASSYRATKGKLAAQSLALDELDLYAEEFLRDLRREQLARIDSLEKDLERAAAMIPEVSRAAQEDTEQQARVEEASHARSGGLVEVEDDPDGADEVKEGDEPDLAVVGTSIHGTAGTGLDVASTELDSINDFLDTIEAGLFELRAGADETGDAVSGAARSQCDMYSELVGDASAQVGRIEASGVRPPALGAVKDRITAMQEEIAALLSGAPSAKEAEAAAKGPAMGGMKAVAQMSVSELRTLLTEFDIPHNDVVERSELEERARIVMPDA